MEPTPIWIALGTGTLVGVHLLAGRFHALVGSERSAVHSVLAGITTAYLFLKLFPELGAPTGQGVGPDGGGGLSRRGAYAIALLGFTAFYAAEVWAHRDPATGARQGRDGRVYRLLIGTFALFNAVIAFLLPYQVATGGPWVGGTYVAAIAVHLLVQDHAVAEVHGGRYGIHARLIHSSGLLVGLLLWILLAPGTSNRLVHPLLAFLGGAIALQVIQEEIPAYKQGRPAYFTLGAVAFGIVMMLMERLPA